MQALKLSLALVLTLAAQNGFASIVPIEDELLQADVVSRQGDMYQEAYVQLNKTQKTISLILQPVTPSCSDDEVCLRILPTPLEYFFPKAVETVDSCDAVIYSAEQVFDHRIKVSIVDNTNYNYQRCPTLAPVPETVVQIQQTYLDQTGEQQWEESFAGAGLAALRY